MFVIVGYILVLVVFLLCQGNISKKVRDPECGKATHYIQRNNDMMVFVVQSLRNILRTADRIVLLHDSVIMRLEYSLIIRIRQRNFNGYKILLCNIWNVFFSLPWCLYLQDA